MWSKLLPSYKFSGAGNVWIMHYNIKSMFHGYKECFVLWNGNFKIHVAKNVAPRYTQSKKLAQCIFYHTHI